MIIYNILVIPLAHNTITNKYHSLNRLNIWMYRTSSSLFLQYDLLEKLVTFLLKLKCYHEVNKWMDFTCKKFDVPFDKNPHKVFLVGLDQWHFKRPLSLTTFWPFKGQQLVWLSMCGEVWVGWICMGDGGVAGPCMLLCMFVFLLHVVQHGDVGGASLCSLLGL